MHTYIHVHTYTRTHAHADALNDSLSRTSQHSVKMCKRFQAAPRWPTTTLYNMTWLFIPGGSNNGFTMHTTLKVAWRNPPLENISLPKKSRGASNQVYYDVHIKNNHDKTLPLLPLQLPPLQLLPVLLPLPFGRVESVLLTFHTAHGAQYTWDARQ